MSVLSRKSRRADAVPLSQDSINRSIALGQYQPNANPDLAESLFSQIRALKDQGHLDEAQLLLQPLLNGRVTTRLFQALMLQAEIYGEQKNYSQAQACYELLLENVDADDQLSAQEALRLKGLVQLNAGWLCEQSGALAEGLLRYNQAIICFEALAEQIPALVLTSLMMAYRQRARVYRLLGQVTEALQDLERSAQAQTQVMTPLAVNTDILKEWFSLGLLQQDLGHWTQALASHELALRQCSLLPNGPERERWTVMIQTQRAFCCEQLEQPELALELYQQALNTLDVEQEPLQFVLLRLLKIALQLRLEPEWPDAVIAFAELKQTLDQLELAGADRAELAVPLLALAGLCHERETDWALDFYSMAIRCLEQTRRQADRVLQGRLIDAYRGRAELLETLGHPLKALGSLKQAVRLAEQMMDAELQAELQVQIGLLYQNLNKPEAAINAFEQARLLDQPVSWAIRNPEDSWFKASYFLAFLLATEQHYPERALNVLLEIQQVCPGYIEYDLACLYAKLEQSDQAFEYLQKHLQSPSALSFEDISADSDLAALQTDSRWQQLF